MEDLDVPLTDLEIDSALEAIEAAISARDTGLLERASSRGIRRRFTRRECEEALLDAGAQRALVEQLQADAIADLTRWVYAAVDAGIDTQRVAQLAQLAPKTVAALLDGPGAPTTTGLFAMLGLPQSGA